MSHLFNSRRNAFTLLELLVVVAISAVLLGLLLVGVQHVRNAAARLQCQNKIKQLAIALHLHSDTHQRFPTGFRSSQNPEFMAFSGWTLSVLPYIEQSALHNNAVNAYHQTRSPFVRPPHTGIDTVVSSFVCPSDGRAAVPQLAVRSTRKVAFTCYLGVSGRDYASGDGVLFRDSQVRFTDITDGSSNTLMLGERPPSSDFQFGWWYAGSGQQFTGSGDLILGVRERNLLPIVSGSRCGPGFYDFSPSYFEDPCGMFHFWSPHSGGANFAFADGAVRFLTYSTNSLLPALASRSGGEVVALE